VADDDELFSRALTNMARQFVNDEPLIIDKPAALPAG
jgi:hypothetical protein